jgi:hypothetical protein
MDNLNRYENWTHTLRTIRTASSHPTRRGQATPRRWKSSVFRLCRGSVHAGAAPAAGGLQ